MIRTERKAPGVEVITLDRPERRNAVNAEACEALADAVLAAAGSGEVRALVLTGEGPHFCAGADLKGVEDETFAGHLRRALNALHEVPIVTMAAVHGAALGAGTQLAVACDLRVVSPDARFGVPSAKLGLMVDHWTVQRVASLAGQGPARAMLLAAEEINAHAALSLGLANREGYLDAAITWAERIATLAPLTIAGQKLALNRLEPPIDDPDVAEAFRRAWRSEDLKEGMAAFAEKRSPDFRGR